VRDAGVYPLSAVDRRRQPLHTMSVLYVNGGVQIVKVTSCRITKWMRYVVKLQVVE
jgi:hypothetical protein